MFREPEPGARTGTEPVPRTGTTYLSRRARQSGYSTAYPFYLQKLVCDTENVDRVYALDIFNKVSIDGGTSWSNLGEDHKRLDNHALWIDPEDPRHLLSVNDGGVYESFDRGENWRFKAHLPIAEAHKVTVDTDEPFYNVYIGTQNNNSLGGPSRTINSTGITNADWTFTLGGDGFETQVDWSDPNILYSQFQFGGLVRYDKRTGERLFVRNFEEAGSEALRFDWDAALLISRHDPARLYHGSNKVPFGHGTWYRSSTATSPRGPGSSHLVVARGTV